MTRVFLFDAGHTLLHTTEAVGEVYAREAAALGARADPVRLGEAYARVWDENASRFARESLGRAAGDAQDAEHWRWICAEVHRRTPGLAGIDPVRWFERLHDAFGRSDHWRRYPDVVPTLTELRRRGAVVGVVSNWSTRLRGIARAHGLEELADFILISSEFGAGKPDPRIFAGALERAGASPAEAVHVGDSVEDDVRGAERSGIRPVLVWRRAGEPPPLDGIRIVRDLRELL